MLSNGNKAVKARLDLWSVYSFEIKIIIDTVYHFSITHILNSKIKNYDTVADMITHGGDGRNT